MLFTSIEQMDDRDIWSLDEDDLLEYLDFYHLNIPTKNDNSIDCDKAYEILRERKNIIFEEY